MENFVLRRITSDQTECNEILGDSYHIIYRESEPEEFKSHCKIIGLTDEVMKEKCYALLVGKDGSMTKPLYMDSEYYIMSTNGNTFANVTYR